MRVLTLLLIVIFNQAKAQKIELLAGFNKNTFYDTDKDPHFESSYSTNNGYTLGLALQLLEKTHFKPRISLSFENYSGELYNYWTFLGGYNSVDAYAKKSIVSLGFYPLNLSIKKKLVVNLGFELSHLIKEKIKGRAISSAWSPNQFSYNRDLSSEGGISSKKQIGIRIRLADELKVS